MSTHSRSRASRNDDARRGGTAHSDQRNAAGEIPPLEWIAAGVGFALICATLAFLVYRGWSAHTAPPDIIIKAEKVVPVSRGYVVEISATNRGPRTAADVKIEGELKSGDSVEETAETTFTYLPSNSHRRGGLFFSKDPRRHELTLRPKGFVTP